MSYHKDQYGILVPSVRGFDPNYKDFTQDSSTRVYTTKCDQKPKCREMCGHGRPMIKSEVDQCIQMYKESFGFEPKTIVIPKTLEIYKEDLEKGFKLVVKTGAKRPNQITLTGITDNYFNV